MAVGSVGSVHHQTHAAQIDVWEARKSAEPCGERRPEVSWSGEGAVQSVDRSTIRQVFHPIKGSGLEAQQAAGVGLCEAPRGEPAVPHIAPYRGDDRRGNKSAEATKVSLEVEGSRVLCDR